MSHTTSQVIASTPDRAEPLCCPHCATVLVPSRLTCPSCHYLVHAEKLKHLACQAEAANQSSDFATSLSLWREALLLLPRDVQQYKAITQKLDQLSRQVDTNEAQVKPVAGNKTEQNKRAAKVTALGTAGLCLWKFKLVFVFLLTKGKMLLFGLSKANTLFTMLLSLGVYWTAWGWKFALGVILSIYVHEIGHVTALKKFGIPAGAPAFIPGLGAFVRITRCPSANSKMRASVLPDPSGG